MARRRRHVAEFRGRHANRARSAQADLSEALAAALEHHHAGRLDEADSAYRDILRAVPDQADARHLRGVVAFQRGRHDDALALIRAAIALDPGTAMYHANLGRVCKAAGRADEAADAYRQALSLDPGNAAAHSDLGAALVSLGRLEEATESCARALALDEGNSEAHYNLGLALQGQGQAAEAAASFRRSLAIDPGFADAHHHLGLALQEQGLMDQAAASYRRAVELASDLVEAHCNLGNVLRDQGALEDAVAAYRRALRIAPETPEVHSNLGVALQELGELDAALASYDRAMALRPDDAEARRNRAMALLLTGRFAEGWEDYEWRWQTRSFEGLRRDFPQPRWDGSDLDGRSILLHAEQGLGDTVQFVRYAPLVHARGGRVILECDPLLTALMGTAKGIDRVVARRETPTGFDTHAPLLSLPRLFGTTLETIPAGTPYLAADPRAVAAWRARIRDDGRLKVGLVWAGSPAHRNDRNRSVPVRLLAPLTETDNARFFGLQVGERAADLRGLAAGAVKDLSPLMSDFSESAAAISHLDLVVTVDTGTAHLAGALGKPVWVLLPFVPDWRWLLDRDDSPWYPTMRLFRQRRAGDWKEVIARVRDALMEPATQAANSGRPSVPAPSSSNPRA